MDGVTGGFSFTGGFIQRLLLSRGHEVRTLTNHPARWSTAPGGVEVVPLRFDPEHLRRSLDGIDTFYNTYWIRFPHAGQTFDQAVEKTGLLARCALEAGVRRFVHISVSNPSLESGLDYYRGKAQAEKAVMDSGVPWAIVRPTLIFGEHDILLNNIAWLLRRLPLFLVPGRGDYRLQPVSGEDVARIAVAAAAEPESVIWDAAGPDTFTYRELVQLLASVVGRRPVLVRTPPSLVIGAGAVVGWAKSDVVLTRQELEGLMEELLVSHEAPRGLDRLEPWLRSHADSIGSTYASELRRHFD